VVSTSFSCKKTRFLNDALCCRHASGPVQP
jgi:hypothetical protein